MVVGFSSPGAVPCSLRQANALTVSPDKGRYQKIATRMALLEVQTGSAMNPRYLEARVQ
jgi:hypothetical protein